MRGLPAVVFVDPDGSPRREPRVTRFMAPDDFLAVLDAAFEERGGT